MDLSSAVQQLLTDMRREHQMHHHQSPSSAGSGVHPSGVASQQQEGGVGGGDSGATQVARAMPSLEAERQIARLTEALRHAEEALYVERQRHEQTRELLRLALRPSSYDASAAPSGGQHMEEHAAGRSGGGVGASSRGRRRSPDASSYVVHGDTAVTPAFVDEAAVAARFAAQRGAAGGEGTLAELLHRAATPTRRGGGYQVGAGGGADSAPAAGSRSGGGGMRPVSPRLRTASPPGGQQLSVTGGGSRHAGGGGTRSTTGGGGAHPLVFGGRTPRFAGISLNGDHYTLTSRYSGNVITDENTPRPGSASRRTTSPRLVSTGADVAARGGGGGTPRSSRRESTATAAGLYHATSMTPIAAASPSALHLGSSPLGGTSPTPSNGGKKLGSATLLAAAARRTIDVEQGDRVPSHMRSADVAAWLHSLSPAAA